MTIFSLLVTFLRCARKFMVVDLQGVLKNDLGRKTYLLTDPAIHHKRQRENGKKVARQHGRTDFGRLGMRAFFETHRCNCLCKLFNFQEKTSKEQLDAIYKIEDDSEDAVGKISSLLQGMYVTLREKERNQ